MSRLRSSQEFHLPRSWRDHLPDSALYYGMHVEKLSAPNAAGFSQGLCPFHADKNASLSINIRNARGAWRCFAGCGSGDLVSFHMKLTCKQFADAVRELIGGRK